LFLLPQTGRRLLIGWLSEFSCLSLASRPSVPHVHLFSSLCNGFVEEE
jgi:hypothetical protein